MRLADRLPGASGRTFQPGRPASHPPRGADPLIRDMIRSTGVPLKRSMSLGIDVVGEHVSKGVGDCRWAVHTAHKRDLPLLLMTDRMRHDPQARVAAMARFRIRQRDRSLVVLGHEIRTRPLPTQVSRRPRCRAGRASTRVRPPSRFASVHRTSSATRARKS